MRLAAFDLSLTRTGYARFDDAGIEGAGLTIGTLSGSSVGMPRLAHIRDAVLRIAAGANLVLLEGYAFARANQAHQLGELGGVVRLALFEARHVVVEVPPSCLKKYATGKGNAGKPQVLAEAIRRLNYQGSDDNEADALWLLQMALAHLGRPEAVEVPALHRDGLTKVRWPR